MEILANNDLDFDQSVSELLSKVDGEGCPPGQTSQYDDQSTSINTI
jgi:hypothetical protein